jgi:hypothetical protein
MRTRAVVAPPIHPQEAATKTTREGRGKMEEGRGLMSEGGCLMAEALNLEKPEY